MPQGAATTAPAEARGMKRRTSAGRSGLHRIVLGAALLVLAITVTLVLPLRWLPPLTSSFMIITWAGKAADAGDMHYQWVSRHAISRRVPEAVLASEDQKFFDHWGFDFKAIRKAIGTNQRSQRTRGASTISQQLAKNLYLWPERSWLRKGLEAWLTLWLEILLPKERILELYLNVAQFGPTIFGVEAAARQYYGKPASRLNRHEAAMLAAVLPNPVTLRASRPSRYVLRRQAWIMRQAARIEKNRQINDSNWPHQ